ncbi:DinB family protein [Peribacillus sp. B-H-3]|uniref:DinB family protein n=1 Tax=Peribacillus sp. B-H-3 TaxID=3400420 RepID=UPI003B018D5E
MEDLIFRHMETVRGITENLIKKFPEETADIVPEGFNNSIRWNFGHIAFIQEKLVFGLLGKEGGLPEEYEEFFKAGSKPADWSDAPPSMSEIADELSKQKSRIRSFLESSMDIKFPEPFTNKAGIKLYTSGEAFLFSFFHEAMHIETIKLIYRKISSQ